MGKWSYNAIQVTQWPDAPPLYLFSAEVEELLKWADVPRKISGAMAGYQRILEPRRTEAIKDFIQQDARNIIPGAIIIVVKEGFSVESTSIDGVHRITVEFDLDADFTARMQVVRNQLFGRLSEEERSGFNELQSSDLMGDDRLLEGVEDEEESLDPLEEEKIDVFPQTSYLTRLVGLLDKAINDFESLAPERKEAISRYVESISKPGQIMDGQHRVFGAKDVNQHDVYMPIVLIPNLSSAEQVFHFCVINDKAQRVKKTHTRANASTSLTQRELLDLYDRLTEINVDTDEAVWTDRLDSDPQSPFKGIVDWELGSGNLIKERIAYQVVRAFMKPGRDAERVLHRSSEKWERNESDFRLKMFYAFWSSIRKNFPRARKIRL